MIRSGWGARLYLVGVCVLPVPLRAADDQPYTRTQDVIYHRKYGTALTFDVLTPRENANGAAVIFCVSGGWFSSHEAINPGFVMPFLNRGYTVFAVVHGSQPKFTIPEILDDMHRAVRFIRHHAKRYGIDPERIGITGGSAGGHLSLMQGTAGRAGDTDAKDTVDRASSRVQAVACFFPPTDFLNWGKSGYTVVQALENELRGFRPPFDYHEYDDETRRLERITDQERRLEISKQISPITHVSADDPPTLIVHGDADLLVPIQQAEVIVDKMREAGVTAELVVKPGAAHGWPDMIRDIGTFVDWFDKHLATSAKEPSAP